MDESSASEAFSTVSKQIQIFDKFPVRGKIIRPRRNVIQLKVGILGHCSRTTGQSLAVLQWSADHMLRIMGIVCIKRVKLLIN